MMKHRARFSPLSLLVALALAVGCAAETGSEADTNTGVSHDQVRTCSDADMLQVRARIQAIHGAPPSEEVLADVGAAAFLTELFDFARSQGWSAHDGMANLVAVTHGHIPADFSVARVVTQFGRHPCKLDSSWLIADPADLRDHYDEDGVFNQVYHTAIYIYGGYFGPSDVIELENVLHEGLDHGHVDDFTVGDAGIALGEALRRGTTLRDVVLDRYYYHEGGGYVSLEHARAYRRIHESLEGDPLYDTTVTWSNFARMVDFVLSDGGTPLRDVEWVRCAQDSCPVYYGTDIWGSLPLLANVPRGTTMGVMVRSGARAVVSYPMTDRGSAVQVINYFAEGWVDGGHHPHGPLPTDDRAVRWVWCDAGSCPVYYSRDAWSGRDLLGHQGRCTRMGIFLTDGAADHHVVSYPMSDRAYSVQVVPESGGGWTTRRPEGC